MTLIVRHTDVLGGYEPGLGGGIVGGFNPLNAFRGWRVYSVVGSYEDPAGIEFPAIRIRKVSGPPTDTISQHGARVDGFFVPRIWPYGGGLLSGNFPELAWYFLDPATLAFVAGPLLPIGNTFNNSLSQATRDVTPVTEHVVQWFEHTLPTGPYIGIHVARSPSDTYPLWVSGHPVEIVAERIAAKGEAYETASKDSVQESIGPEAQHVMPVTDPAQSPQDVIDAMSEAWGFTVRRSTTSGKAEFVHWREKLNGLPTPTIGLNDIREEGGPTFELSDATRLTRVRLTGQVISQWKPGTMMVPTFKMRRFLGIPIGPPKVRFVSRPDLNQTEKPASGLMITSAEVSFNYSSDGVTADSEAFGESEAEIDVAGMPALLNSVAGGATPVNFELWAQGVARLLFDSHSRGRQMATVVTLRGTDADDIEIGDAVTLDLAHLPNAQLGQTPTSQRGDERPFRCVARTEQMPGPVLRLADEGTGVPLDIDITLRLLIDTGPNGEQILLVQVTPAEDLADAAAQVEFQVRVFADGDPLEIDKPGMRVTVFDSSLWTETGSDPHELRLGDYAPNHQVIVRARAWRMGGAAGDWSLWYGLGGPITGPQTTLSDLVIDQVTDEGARLTWSYDEAPPVGTVRVQIRDITTIIGSWTNVTGSPFAAGTETTTLTGYLSGHRFEVRVVLLDSGPAEYGDVLLGSFATTGGLISGLSITSPTSDGAKLNWTNTDATRTIIVEYRVDGTTAWSIFSVLPPGSNRERLVGLAALTTYNVRVSAGAFDSDGASGPGLTDDFTTLATTETLSPPLFAGVFWDVTQDTSVITPGLYGIKLFANPQNVMPHDMVIEEAVETSEGSMTPGAFAEIAIVPAVSGNATFWSATAPNDGLWRYLRALSRKAGYNDSVETESLPAKPWSVTPNPSGGGGANVMTLTATALAAGGDAGGSFALPHGAEIFKIESNSLEARFRLYTDSATRTSDLSRPITDHTWPYPNLLLDGELLAADSPAFTMLATTQQRIRIDLGQHPDLLTYYTIGSLEAGTEDFEIRVYFFGPSSTPA